MKIRLTESQLKRIIEDNIRMVLSESEDSIQTKICAALRSDGLNMAEVARALISGPWKGMSEDTARSKLSKVSRNELPMNPKEQQVIFKALKGLGRDIGV